MRKTFIHSIGILTVVLLITYAQSWGVPESANEHRANDPMVFEETVEVDKGSAVSTGGNVGIDLPNEGNIGFDKPSINSRLQMAEVKIRDYGVIFPDGKYQSKAWRSSINGIFFLAGNVGIGTYNPGEELEIYGNYPYVKFNGHTSSDARQIGVNDLGLSIYNPVDDRYDMIINNAGNVGIGATSPVAKLHVEAGAGEGLRVMNSNGNSHFPYSNGWSYISGKGIIFRSNGNNEGMRLDPEGQLLIGKTAEAQGKTGYNLQVSGSGLFGVAVNAAFFIDRTPYPKDLETAYAAVLSMERLPPEEYDENNKETQLDHSKLHGFIKSQDGMYRDLSATVSAQNEVIKDLLKRIEELEVKLK